MTISSDEPELRALMLAGLDGDEASHKSLLTKLSAYLRAYFKGQLARIGRGPSDAEDLVQETLIALHTRRHTYDRSQLLTPWVYAIARYRLVDYLRRTKSANMDVPVEAAEGVFANDDVSAVDSGLDLTKLLAQLTPKMRQAIQFVKLDGMSVSEAAVRAGMSQSAIKVSVHRGLRALSLLVRERSPMMKFRSRPSAPDVAPPVNTLIGVGSNLRGTLMVTGTLRIEGEFEGDILNCERLEIGEHGVMRSDVEVKGAIIEGRVHGNIRALGVLEMKSGAHVEGDVAAISVVMEPGVHFTGRCTMLENGSESVELSADLGRVREYARD